MSFRAAEYGGTTIGTTTQYLTAGQLGRSCVTLSRVTTDPDFLDFLR